MIPLIGECRSEKADSELEKKGSKGKIFQERKG